MAIIFGADESTVARIGFTLGEKVIAADGPIELEAVLAANSEENLVIVDPGVSIGAALAISQKYRSQIPKLGVILLRRRIDVQVLQEALRAGIREVVPADDASALLDACNRSRSLSGQMGEQRNSTATGKIVLVFAAKGGCGKTTLSTNLAIAIAEQTQQPTCLVDFDLEFGDVAIAMQIEPIKTISDAVPIATTLDEQAIKSIVVKRNEHLDILLAPKLPADADSITPQLAERVLAILAQQYSYVIVDSPPAFTDVILTAFDLAHEYVLITTLDMPAIKNLQVTLDTLDTLGYEREKCHVVINRSTTRSGLTPKDVAQLIDIDIQGEIPSSSEVSASINHGQTILEQSPKHPVSRAIAGVATIFTGVKHAPRAKRRFRVRRK